MAGPRKCRALSIPITIIRKQRNANRAHQKIAGRRTATGTRTNPEKSVVVRPMARADFDLQTPFHPAGDQPKAISELSAGLERGDRFQTLLGVTGSGKTMTMANVIKHHGRPTLVLSHNKTLAAQLYGELKSFFPRNAVEYFISYYDYYQPEAYVPTTDTYIEKDASINEDIQALRLRATSSLMEREDVIIVATVSAIYGLGDPIEYRQLMVTVGVGEERGRDVLLADLVAVQYHRNDVAFDRGTRSERRVG